MRRDRTTLLDMEEPDEAPRAAAAPSQAGRPSAKQLLAAVLRGEAVARVQLLNKGLKHGTFGAAFYGGARYDRAVGAVSVVGVGGGAGALMLDDGAPTRHVAEGSPRESRTLLRAAARALCAC